MSAYGYFFYFCFTCLSKNRFRVYLKYTSLLNSWWTQSIYILETFSCTLFSKLLSNYFHKGAGFGRQNLQSILEVYFIFRIQMYIWSIAQFQQGKILVEVYIIFWSNGLVVSVQIYQSRESRFKTIRWLKMRKPLKMPHFYSVIWGKNKTHLG